LQHSKGNQGPARPRRLSKWLTILGDPSVRGIVVGVTELCAHVGAMMAGERFRGIVAGADGVARPRERGWDAAPADHVPARASAESSWGDRAGRRCGAMMAGERFRGIVAGADRAGRPRERGDAAPRRSSTRECVRGIVVG
jgi:hypothetical protein